MRIKRSKARACVLQKAIVLFAAFANYAVVVAITFQLCCLTAFLFRTISWVIKVTHLCESAVTQLCGLYY